MQTATKETIAVTVRLVSLFAVVQLFSSLAGNVVCVSECVCLLGNNYSCKLSFV